MKIILYLIFLLSFNLLSSYANEPDLHFKHLTTSEGLSNNSVHYVYQDRKGFMWFGTDDGLNMYDGYDFTLFKNNSDDPGSVSSNSVFEILEDSKNQIWIATSNGVDIFQRDRLRFKHIPFFDNGGDFQYQSYTRAIVEDKKGNILIANPVGVFIYDTLRHGFVRFLNDSDASGSIQQEGIRAMLLDNSNRIWVGSVGYGLYGFDLINHKLLASSKNDGIINLHEKIYSLSEDVNGDIWAGTENGIFIINSDLKAIIHIDLLLKTGSIGSNRVLDIYFENNERTWIATEGGLINYNRAKNDFSLYATNEFDPYSLNNNSIRSICKDKQGLLWLGTYQGGVNFTQLKLTKEFRLFKNEKGNPNSLSYDAVSALFEDSHGMLWIGTDGGGVDMYNPVSGNFTHYLYKPGKANSISGNSILSITEDKFGRIWVGGYLSGINIIDRTTGKITQLKHDPHNINSISNDDVRDFLFDENNKVWIVTNGGGLDILDQKTGTFQHFREGTSNSIVSNWCLKLFNALNGDIWIGTYNGLSICDPKSMTFRNFTHNSSPGSISNSWVYAFAEDKSGNMWIGTANGLNVFPKNSNVFTHIQMSDGLPNEVINGILIDKLDDLWLSTNKGLVRYSPDVKKFRNYTVSDGLQGMQFIHGSAFKSKSGEMYFGGLNGFNAYYPENIQDNQYIPDIYLRDLLIFYKSANKNIEGTPLNKSIEMADEIILSYRQSLITFKYAALNFVSPEKNQYAYMLEGFDKNWIYVGSRREATYTNLNPGTYYFKVKASNDDGIWNQTGTSIKVIVLPPWWKTWIFRISSVLFIAAVIMGIFFIRVNDLKNQKIKLEQLVKVRTHEIIEKNLELSSQADVLVEINTLLEEKQQRIQQQAEVLSKANSLLEERQQQIGEQTEELMAQKDELEKVNAHLKELNSTKDRFFSIIAHDLKNPFGTILGFAEILMMNYEKITDEKRKDFISIIFKSSQNLFNLLENLLLWSRSQTNSIRFEPVNFNLNVLIDENISLLQEMYQNKSIELIFNSSDKFDVFADRNMISTVIRNLLSNAIKFTRNNGKISISLIKEVTQVTVSVSDNGMGMTEAEAAQLFKVDVHHSREGTAGETGTGLGLLLCKEYIDKHQAKIWVESTVGKGSTFYFTVPVSS
jgi:signal transduction histidine kinase/ligand-binding sensor domain-containing protein